MAENKYDKYFLTEFKEPANLPGVDGPQAYFRGARQIPGANLNLGWQLFVRPMLLEKEPHTHDFDEYLVFLGGTLPDLFSSFQAEIDFCIGEELEQHLIDKATIIFIPRGMVHCPLNIRKVDKPFLFQAILEAPKFIKTMQGKEYSYDGPAVDGPVKL